MCKLKFHTSIFLWIFKFLARRIYSRKFKGRFLSSGLTFLGGGGEGAADKVFLTTKKSSTHVI